MSKPVKYFFIGLLAFAGLLIGGLIIVAATFEPNEYKSTIIKLVQEKKQRTLSIPGEIKLSLFPKLAIDLGQVSLSEHKGSAEFASIDSAKLSLAWLPLLTRQLVVDRVTVDGLHANIKRYQDGSTNFDDLLTKEDSGGKLQFEIEGVKLSNSRVVFEDQLQDRRIEATNLEVETGRIADGATSNIALRATVKGNKPAIDADVAWNSDFMIDIDKKRYAFKNIESQLKGKLADFPGLAVKLAGDADLHPAENRFTFNEAKLQLQGIRREKKFEANFAVPKLAVTEAGVSGGKLSGEATIVEGQRSVRTQLSAASFEGTPQKFKIPSLVVDSELKDGDLAATAKLAGTLAGNLDKQQISSPEIKLTLSGKKGNEAIMGNLSTPLQADLKAQMIELPKLDADLTFPHAGGGTLKLNASGKSSIDLAKQDAALLLKGKLDESAFDAKLGLNNFSPASYTFDVAIDQLDADRYRRKQSAAEPAAEKKDKVQNAKEPFDLSGWRDLQASGKLRVGSLKFNGIKAANVRLDMQAERGKIDLNPLAANLYGGSAAGSVSVTASKAPKLTVRQTLSGVDIGLLLEDALDKDRLEGRGNLMLDIATEGGDFDQWKQNLDGTAKIELRDGSVRGINIAQTVRNAKAQIGLLQGKEPPQTGTASSNEKTDFSEMTGSFQIANGVARNDDLSIKSPLLRINGGGTIDLAAERLDYLAKTTIVSSLQGQGGPELQALKGLTVPVKLSGPFDALAWRVDFQGLAADLVKQKLNEQADKLFGKNPQQADSPKNKIEDQLKEQLKGLFGR